MKKSFDVSSAALHIMAMAFMLLDHMWATVTPGNEWMTCIGRIAFPIFAFMIVEGYFHTRSFKKYMIRLLIFAVISEIPFDLMYEGAIIYPYHQNVIWTFLLSLLIIRAIEAVKTKHKLWLTILVSVLIVPIGMLLGTVAMLDYYGAGVAMVLTFYFFRGRKWWCYVGQLILMSWLNLELLGGYYYPVTIFGREFEILQQGFAMLALIPIWLYKGRQGYHNKTFQYICYAFYPGHILILDILMKIFEMLD